MGGYCKFCNNRCFQFFPAETPKHILAAYGTSNIIATCPGGQQFEREKVGYCLDDIKEAIRLSEAAEQNAMAVNSMLGTLKL